MKKSGLSLVFSLLVLLGINGHTAAQSTRYTVQLEATQELDVALNKVKGFKGQGLDAYIVKIDVQDKGTFYRIRVGNFPTQADARKYAADLQRLGFSSEFYIAPYEAPQGDLPEAAPTRGVAAPAAGAGSTPPAKEQPKKEEPKQPAPSASTPPPAPPAKDPAKQSAASAKAAPAGGNEQKLVANLTSATTNPITPPAPAPVTAAPAAAAVNPAALNFIRFQDQAIGYSFERPQAWEGGQLDTKDTQDQKVSAGALFKSYQDSAFITAIWNTLEKANSPEQDNDLIVQLILQSMGSDAGTQQMTETSRKVVSENGTIKTYLDLKATFKSQGQEGPLDFLGKGVIARTNKGILLVVAFYWQGGPPYVSGVADKIIASVKPPL